MAILRVKSRYSGEVIFEAEAESFKEVVEAAVRSKADLRSADLRDSDLNGADLGGADLSGADLSRAYLSGANMSVANLSGADLRCAVLSGADLRCANLRRANLCGADLSRADLSGANLRGANLRGADLCGAELSETNLSDADLRGADLRGADLCGARLNWHSRELMSAVLLQKSEGDIERIKVAGAILCLRDWCWDELFKLISDPQFSWAMDTLAGYVVDGDVVPEELVNWKNQSRETSREGGLS